MRDATSLLLRVRAFCLALPGVRETTTFGNPTFQAAKRTFAVLDRYRGRRCLCFKATLEEQRKLGLDPRFYPAPYGAKQGWTCLDLEGRIPWRRAERSMARSHRLVSYPKDLTRARRGRRAAPAKRRQASSRTRSRQGSRP
jgi:predicted DNA-binding protein (MmcQ/YjbR family)